MDSRIKAAGRTSGVFSRRILEEKVTVNSHKKTFSCFPYQLDHGTCNPAPVSVLSAHLSLELPLSSPSCCGPPRASAWPTGTALLNFLPGKLVLLELLLLLLAAIKLLHLPVALVPDTISMVTPTSHCWTCIHVQVLHVGGPVEVLPSCLRGVGLQ